MDRSFAIYALPVYAILAGIVLAALISGLPNTPLASAEKIAKNQCAANCHPHVSAMIETECYCAVDDGYIPLGTFQGILTAPSSW